MSDPEVISRLKKELDNGRRAVLLTLTYKEGSGPRDLGSKMLITADGETVGTIGGGGMERLIVKEALDAMEEGKPRILHFAMGVPAREGMIGVNSKCGGEVKIFMDVMKPVQRLIIMGSGLIAQTVARYANECGFEIVIIDDADTASLEIFPFAAVINDPYPESLNQLEIRPNDYVLMLHGETDFELAGLRYAVDASPSFVGLLGSSNKVREHKRQLKEEGYLPLKVDKIVGHVGLDIGAETPEEIGISIVAQLIKVKNS